MAKPQKHSKPHQSSKRPGKHGTKNLKPKTKSSKKLKKPNPKAPPQQLPPPPPPQLLTTASQQLEFFIQQYQSANGIQLSSLELEPFTDACIVKLSENLPQDVSNLSEHIKASFGASWKQVLCKKELKHSQPGSPALLTISLSALRSLELLRSLKPFTKECHAAKLFAKHLKIEEQVSLLKNHVNVACGTPSRIKKLIDMEALGLSRLSIVVLDMHTDIKGFSLFNIPQISDEFWELYTTHFHQRLLDGSLRICLYGTIDANSFKKKKGKMDANE